MRKTICRIILVTLIASLLPSMPALAADTAPAVKNNSPVLVDDIAIKFTAYLINDNNYVRLRDVAQTVNFGVYYDASTRSAYLDTKGNYDGETVVPATDMPETVEASSSDTPIYVDGARVNMTAYMIGGNNFVKLRDIAQAVNFGVWYNSETRLVHIDTGSPYIEEFTEATSSGRFSSVPLTVRYLDGMGRSREDFSRNANPAIFTNSLTREAYNAVFQTILDRETILAGNDGSNRNPYYDYAYNCSTDNWDQIQLILGRISGEYSYLLGGEPIAKEVYKYPGYFVCKVNQSINASEEARLSNGIIAEADRLTSDREKVILLNDFLCERMVYVSGEGSSRVKIFSASRDNPVPGACGTFAGTLNYLCNRANIPCITITGDNHAWNAVYVDNGWYYVDVSANCKAGYNWILLEDSYTWRNNAYPHETLFAMELVVPGSTV